QASGHGAGWGDETPVGEDWALLAACRADERIRGARWQDEKHGALTAGLLEALTVGPAEQLSTLRWMDIMPAISNFIAERSKGTTQHPVLDGRPEQTVFGGPWRQVDTRISEPFPELPSERPIGVTLSGVPEAVAAAIARTTERGQLVTLNPPNGPI